jgi:8-oxo-dGTP pyrophosphatase MutT (NUDIX family)
MERVPLKAWKTLAKKTILDHGKYLVVESHQVQLHDGKVIEDWPWVITPDFVNVVAETENGEFLCFRQRKYGLKEVSLAPIGGYIELGETALQAAKRELSEETGYDAPEWVPLGEYLVGPNRGFATGYPFLARSAVWRIAPVNDDLEEQELLLLGRDALEDALDRGDFKILAWAHAVGMALRVLARL